MKFHEYTLQQVPPGWEHKAREQLLTHYTRQDAVINRLYLEAVGGPNEDAMAHHNRIANAEHIWLQDRRPFYRIYPWVVDALGRTNVDLTVDQLPVCRGVAICFAQGHEPTCDGRKVIAMIWARYADAVTPQGTDIPIPQARAVLLHEPGNGCSVLHVTGTEHKISDAGKFTEHDIRFFGIGAGVTMLAQDEQLVEPLLLQRDRGRDLSPEQLAAAIRRAERRTGMRGFVIGARAEVSPHVRRPHFAIRWKGHGEPKTPVLVPIKGSVVHRNKVTQVPTGRVDNSANSGE